MVLDDPDVYELEESRGIGIFVPGSNIEREIDGGLMLKTLLLTLAAFGIVTGLTFVFVIPLMAAGLIIFDLNTLQVIYNPWALILISVTELGFIIPPMWYIKGRGFDLRSLGIKSNGRVKDVLLGLGVGAVMLTANIAITWFIAEATGVTYDGTDLGFGGALDIYEVVAWVIVMFVFVGFSEELLFRGYLQRRMEIFLRPKSGGFKIWALVITSLLFAAFHLDLIGLPTRFVLGLFLGYLCQKRRYSILGSSVAHGFNNAAIVVLAFLGF
jgi:membrane protease YdiL (CAAX protease family)